MSSLIITKLLETTLFCLMTISCPWSRTALSSLKSLQYTISFLTCLNESIMLITLLLLSNVKPAFDY